MNPMPPDPYAILGVSKTAQIHEIRTAYRKKVLTCHPDKVSPGENERVKEEKLAEFQRVQTAYETLSNEEERAKYDDLVRRWELRGSKPATANTSATRAYKVNINMANFTRSSTFPGPMPTAMPQRPGFPVHEDGARKHRPDPVRSDTYVYFGHKVERRDSHDERRSSRREKDPERSRDRGKDKDKDKLRPDKERAEAEARASEKTEKSRRKEREEREREREKEALKAARRQEKLDQERARMAQDARATRLDAERKEEERQRKKQQERQEREKLERRERETLERDLRERDIMAGREKESRKQEKRHKSQTTHHDEPEVYEELSYSGRKKNRKGEERRKERLHSPAKTFEEAYNYLHQRRAAPEKISPPSVPTPPPPGGPGATGSAWIPPPPRFGGINPTGHAMSMEDVDDEDLPMRSSATRRGSHGPSHSAEKLSHKKSYPGSGSREEPMVFPSDAPDRPSFKQSTSAPPHLHTESPRIHRSYTDRHHNIPPAAPEHPGIRRSVTEDMNTGRNRTRRYGSDIETVEELDEEEDRRRHRKHKPSSRRQLSPVHYVTSRYSKKDHARGAAMEYDDAPYVEYPYAPPPPMHTGSFNVKTAPKYGTHDVKYSPYGAY